MEYETRLIVAFLDNFKLSTFENIPKTAQTAVLKQEQAEINDLP